MTDDKKIYRLWWEYLKRSDIYSEICDMRSNKIEYKEASGCYTLGEYCKKGYEAHCLSKGKKPEKRSDEEWNLISGNLRIFGNVINRDFDEWWDASNNWIRRYSSKKPSVIDLGDHTIYGNKSQKKVLCENLPFPDKTKPPSPQKMLKEMASDQSYVLLAIPLVGETNMEDISSQIKIIRDRYKKYESVKKADAELRVWFLPTTRIRYDELKFYLEVYDLRKQGLKLTEVIKMKHPKENEKDAAIQREFNRFHSNAKKIIKNVEKGYFPGNY